MNSKDEQKLLQKAMDELRELEIIIERQDRMMRLNAFMFKLLLLYIPVGIVLIIIQLFFKDFSFIATSIGVLFNVIVILYSIYSHEFVKRSSGYNSTSLKFYRMIFWVFLIINFSVVANYIVTVFNIKISLI